MGTKLDASTDILRGQMHVFLGEEPIAFGKSASLELSADEIDISNKMLGDWAGALSGKKSFTLQADSIASKKGKSVKELFKAFKEGTPVEFVFATATSADQDTFGGTFTATEDLKFSGKVIITSLSIQSNVGEVVNLSVTFKGVGAVTDNVA